MAISFYSPTTSTGQQSSHGQLNRPVSTAFDWHRHRQEKNVFQRSLHGWRIMFGTADAYRKRLEREHAEAEAREQENWDREEAARAYQRSRQQEEIRRVEDREDNAISRRMLDLRRAGINPSTASVGSLSGSASSSQSLGSPGTNLLRELLEDSSGEGIDLVRLLLGLGRLI